MSEQRDEHPITVDLVERLNTLLELDPDHRAIQYKGAWETWGDLRDRVRALDAVLTEAGLGEGARIGIVMRTRPPHVAAITALLSTRRCVVPISSIQSDARIAEDLEALGVPALLADSEDWARQGLAEACRHVGVFGVELGASPGAPVRVLDELAAVPPDPAPAPGVAALMPTSGTTGRPKRVTHRYEHLNGALGRVARYSAATSRSLGGPPKIRDSVVIVHLALAHVAGFWGTLQALCEGRSLSLLDRFDPHEWADLVAEHQPRVAALPPTPLRMVLDAEIPPEKLQSLTAVTCGTAPLDPETHDRFASRYGVAVLTAYGATEFPGGLVGWTLEDHQRFWEHKRGSAGRARPGIKLRVVDPETGAELPAGDEGILEVHSPQATTLTPDGWVRTNDIARLDEDGFLFVTGRADDAINRGGFKIVPQVVEEELRKHPAVADVGVAGIPDERLGQVPVAAVTVREPISEEELTAWAREHLPKVQVPVAFRLVDELPRTPSLKVSKDGVRALFGVEA